MIHQHFDMIPKRFIQCPRSSARDTAAKDLPSWREWKIFKDEEEQIVIRSTPWLLERFRSLPKTQRESFAVYAWIYANGGLRFDGSLKFETGFEQSLIIGSFGLIVVRGDNGMLSDAFVACSRYHPVILELIQFNISLEEAFRRKKSPAKLLSPLEYYQQQSVSHDPFVIVALLALGIALAALACRAARAARSK